MLLSHYERALTAVLAVEARRRVQSAAMYASRFGSVEGQPGFSDKYGFLGRNVRDERSRLDV